MGLKELRLEVEKHEHERCGTYWIRELSAAEMVLFMESSDEPAVERAARLVALCSLESAESTEPYLTQLDVMQWPLAMINLVAQQCMALNRIEGEEKKTSVSLGDSSTS